MFQILPSSEPTVTIDPKNQLITNTIEVILSFLSIYELRRIATLEYFRIPKFKIVFSTLHLIPDTLDYLCDNDCHHLVFISETSFASKFCALFQHGKVFFISGQNKDIKFLVSKEIIKKIPGCHVELTPENPYQNYNDYMNYIMEKLDEYEKFNECKFDDEFVKKMGAAAMAKCIASVAKYKTVMAFHGSNQYAEENIRDEVHQLINWCNQARRSLISAFNNPIEKICFDGQRYPNMRIQYKLNCELIGDFYFGDISRNDFVHFNEFVYKIDNANFLSYFGKKLVYQPNTTLNHVIIPKINTPYKLVNWEDKDVDYKFFLNNKNEGGRISYYDSSSKKNCMERNLTSLQECINIQKFDEFSSGLQQFPMILEKISEIHQITVSDDNDVYFLLTKNMDKIYVYGQTHKGFAGVGHKNKLKNSELVFELYNGEKITHFEAIPITFNTEFLTYDCDEYEYFIYFITSEGNLFYWGHNSFLVENFSDIVIAPRMLKLNDEKIKKLYHAGHRALNVILVNSLQIFIATEKNLYACGNNKNKSLGFNINNPLNNSIFIRKPQPLSFLQPGDSVKDMKFNQSNVPITVFIRTAHGNLYGFGGNAWGNLGLGHTKNVSSPQLIPVGEHKTKIKEIFYPPFFQIQQRDEEFPPQLIPIGNNKTNTTPSPFFQVPQQQKSEKLQCCIIVNEHGQVYACCCESNMDERGLLTSGWLGVPISEFNHRFVQINLNNEAVKEIIYSDNAVFFHTIQNHLYGLGNIWLQQKYNNFIHFDNISLQNKQIPTQELISTIQGNEELEIKKVFLCENKIIIQTQTNNLLGWGENDCGCFSLFSNIQRIDQPIKILDTNAIKQLQALRKEIIKIARSQLNSDKIRGRFTKLLVMLDYFLIAPHSNLVLTAFAHYCNFKLRKYLPQFGSSTTEDIFANMRDIRKNESNTEICSVNEQEAKECFEIYKYEEAICKYKIALQHAELDRKQSLSYTIGMIYFLNLKNYKKASGYFKNAGGALSTIMFHISQAFICLNHKGFLNDEKYRLQTAEHYKEAWELYKNIARGKKRRKIFSSLLAEHSTTLIGKQFDYIEEKLALCSHDFCKEGQELLFTFLNKNFDDDFDDFMYYNYKTIQIKFEHAINTCVTDIGKQNLFCLLKITKMLENMSACAYRGENQKANNLYIETLNFLQSSDCINHIKTEVHKKLIDFIKNLKLPERNPINNNVSQNQFPNQLSMTHSTNDNSSFFNLNLHDPRPLNENKERNENKRDEFIF